MSKKAKEILDAQKEGALLARVLTATHTCERDRGDERCCHRVLHVTIRFEEFQSMLGDSRSIWAIRD